MSSPQSNKSGPKGSKSTSGSNKGPPQVQTGPTRPTTSSPPPPSAPNLMSQSPGPTSSPVSPDPSGDFKVKQTVLANGIYKVTKYVSTKCGLFLVHADIPGPLVSTKIIIGTQSYDDDGLPHTLEHLVFLGSEDYPFKGVLDLIANQCLSNGTDGETDLRPESYFAPTEDDFTAYILSTLGQSGTLTMLPIFLDHIFFPLLTENGFLTEVYHVNGKGEDGGVVYSEQDDAESQVDHRTMMTLARTLYPTTSPYHYIAGGVVKNIKKLQLDKIKNYHKKFYHPKNACIIVCGHIDLQELFKSLESMVQKLVSKNLVHSEPMNSSWLDAQPSPVKTTVEKSIKFQSEEQDLIVTIGFRGPSYVEQIEETLAIQFLMAYLVDSSVAPLLQDFVNGNDPISSSVQMEKFGNAQSAFAFLFESVPRKRGKEIPTRLRASLQKQIENFDLTRIRKIITFDIREELLLMEQEPHPSIIELCRVDFILGRGSSGSFEKRLNPSGTNRKLLSWSKEDWTQRLDKGILKQPWVIITAVPTPDDEDEEESQEVVSTERRRTLGKDGLLDFKRKLETAISMNKVPVPESILKKIQIPPLGLINFHKIQRHRDLPGLNTLPIPVLLDGIESNFAFVTFLMDTTTVPPHVRKYLSIFRDALIKCPYQVPGKALKPVPEVINEVDSHFSDTELVFGLAWDFSSKYVCGQSSGTFCFHAKIELDVLREGTELLQALLWHTIWDWGEVKAIAKHQINDINNKQRSGARLGRFLVKDLLYKDQSNVKCLSLVRQGSFLKDLIDPANEETKKKETLGALETFRRILLDPKHVTLHIATKLKDSGIGNMIWGEVLNLLKGRFKDSSSGSGSSSNLIENTVTKNGSDIPWIHPLSKFQEGPEEILLGIQADISGFMSIVVPGISDYNSPEVPLLRTALEYFGQVEGPLFRAIRDGGFGYSIDLYSQINEGVLVLEMSKVSNIVEAYKAVKGVIEAHANETLKVTETILTPAKSSLIYQILKEEKSQVHMAFNSMVSYLQNVPEGYTRTLIEKIQACTVADVLAMTKKYIKNFVTRPLIAVAVCDVGDSEAVMKGLKSVGRNMKMIPKLDQCQLSKWSF